MLNILVGPSSLIGNVVDSVEVDCSCPKDGASTANGNAKPGSGLSRIDGSEKNRCLNFGA